MIRCLVQREMMHEKGLRPLAATVIEAEANQLCWTTGTSPLFPYGECASNVGARDRVTRGN